MVPRLTAKGIKTFFKSWPFRIVLFIWKTLTCYCWVFKGELSRSLHTVQRIQTLQVSLWKSPECWSSDALAFPIPRECLPGSQSNYSICAYLVWNWNSYREIETNFQTVSSTEILGSTWIVLKYCYTYIVNTREAWVVFFLIWAAPVSTV